MRIRRRTVAAAGCAVAVAALAGCTSTRAAAGSSAPAPAGPTELTSTAVSTPATSASSDTATVPSPTASATVRPTGPSTSSLPPCTTGHLTLRVVKGASANQQAFATLVLHNTGSPCSLIGFPGVTLLLGGKQVGPDAARSSVGYSAVDVPAGGDAHAQLSVLTSCNADRSDTVRVIPPNQTTSLTAPLAVYACQSQISPMQPGAA